MIVVDTRSWLVLRNPEIKAEVAGSEPYAEWLAEHRIYIGESDRAPGRNGDRQHDARRSAPSATRLRMPA